MRAFHQINDILNGVLFVRTAAIFVKVFTALKPDDVHLPQCTKSLLIQVMACHLFGAKPLPTSMLNHCIVLLLQKASVKY